MEYQHEYVAQRNNTFIHPHHNHLKDTVCENSKKKAKKWSFGGLFKRQRTKSSDTDSSTDIDYKKRGFLAKRSHRRKGGSHKVVGKFETIIIPKIRQEKNSNTARMNSIENCNASPNVMKYNYNIGIPNAMSQSNQEISTTCREPSDMIKGSGGSLDTASRRHEKQKVKARVEATRGRLWENSSSSDDCGDSSRTSNCSSLIMQNNEHSHRTEGSLTRKSRAARTDRYVRRHFRDENGHICSSSDLNNCNDVRYQIPGASPNSKWIAKVTCQHFSDYPLHCVSQVKSSNSSPMNSPVTACKKFHSSSLPTKCSTSIDQNKELIKILNHSSNAICNRNVNYDENHVITNGYNFKTSPPPPPPRNPYRKITFPAESDRHVANRPSSYAFDANTQPRDIIAHMQNNKSTGYNNKFEINFSNMNRLHQRSCSDLELCLKHKIIGNPSCSDNINNVHLKENRKMYCTNKNPRSRNPIQVVKNENVNCCDVESKQNKIPNLMIENSCETNNTYNLNNSSSNYFEKSQKNYNTSQKIELPLNDIHVPQIESKEYPYFKNNSFDKSIYFVDNKQLPLNKVNEVGIPIIDSVPICSHPLVNFSSSCSKILERNNKSRPLSVVSEKSDNEILFTDQKSSLETQNISKLIDSKQKPKNLEEALVELEEIYNSLRLSDEDLLDRADRRDLQSALKMNHNYSKWNNTNGDDVDNLTSEEYASFHNDTYLFSPRVRINRRSTKPDTITDDMAYRKLIKKDNQNLKSNPNIVSQSGSFLLMSPTLCPPPLLDIPPSILQIDEEPDVTLDDVVFRNLRQANNTLKVLDPQPPFGIPLGPVSPAANSDYLHATPSGKYRSTFNPSRTPDVVTDDLAFRNLRKDVRKSSPDVTKQYILPNTASKKRRAIRSLSANVVSLIHQNNLEFSDNEVSLVDINGNDFKKIDRSISFNNLPDIIENYNQKSNFIENCGQCSNSNSCNNNQTKSSISEFCNDTDDKTLNYIAGKAKSLSKELKRKLRELEAIPLVSNFDECKENKHIKVQSLTNEKDVFIKGVALHKPITLNQFKINEENISQNGKNSESTLSVNEKCVLSKINNSDLLQPVSTNDKNKKTVVNNDQLIHKNDFSNTLNNECDVEKNDSPTKLNNRKTNEFRFKNLCQNLNWKTMKIVCAQYHPKKAVFSEGEFEKLNNNDLESICRDNYNDITPKSDTIENSSSGILNTPGTSKLCKKNEFPSNCYSETPTPFLHTNENIRAKEIFMDQNSFLSFENATEQFSKELDNLSECYANSSTLSNGNLATINKQFDDHCGTIQYRLSIPEPAGNR